MIFEEKADATLENKNTFIYFLLKGDEVVYVGQTRKGSIRVFAHEDIEYDAAKLIYCKTDDLDKLEDVYIKKYKPMYNKACNYGMNYSLNRARNVIRERMHDIMFNLRQLKELIRELDIQVTMIKYTPYILKDDLEKIINHLEMKEK
jgi:hypothetical protein